MFKINLNIKKLRGLVWGLNEEVFGEQASFSELAKKNTINLTFPDAKQKACLAEALYKQNELSSDQIAKQLNISKPTMYKYLKYRKVKLGEIIDKQGAQQQYAS